MAIRPVVLFAVKPQIVTAQVRGLILWVPWMSANNIDIHQSGGPTIAVAKAASIALSFMICRGWTLLQFFFKKLLFKLDEWNLFMCLYIFIFD